MPTPTPTATPTPTPGTGTKTRTISVSVRKVWDDGDNLEGLRPDHIQVTLLADGTEKQTVTLDEGNGWSATITGLPEKDAKGERIMYVWQEENVPGYTRRTTVDGNETVFTNTHEPELTSVSVRKVWNDGNNEGNTRPHQIVMKLSNGMTVTLSAKNNWTATIENLPVYYKGEKIEYTWTEQEVLGYNPPTVEKRGRLTVFNNTLWTRPDEPSKGKKPKVPGKPTETFEDYETPLGVEAPINHVGDCFD